MKLSALWTQLKKSKYIIKWHGNGCEWLSDGNAAYPVYNLPELTPEILRTLLDVSQDDWRSFTFDDDGELPFSERDNEPLDKELKPMAVTVCFGHVELLPLTDGFEVYLLPMNTLKPLSDLAGLIFYERDGAIIVKEGMILRARITPEVVRDGNHIADLAFISAALRDKLLDREASKRLAWNLDDIRVDKEEA